MTNPTGPTPGPWSVRTKDREPGQVSPPARHEIRAGETTIADLRWNGHNETHGAANAHLIAAAPALLAALKELLDTADAVAFYDAPGRQESDEYEAAQEKARAAIRAAEGAE